MDQRPHIVVVEDEAAQLQLLLDYLSKQGFRVSGADGGAALRRLVERELPQVVLLDVGLPGEDGFALARWLREKSGRIGIIMVTVATDTVDRVVGLESGADDYVPKPFEPRELLARVKSVLRRQGKGGPAASLSTEPRPEVVKIGVCTLDLAAHRLYDASGDEVVLTSMEFDLLHAFATHPDRVLSRTQLLELAHNRDGDVFDRSIDVRMARIRRKIEVDPEKPQVLKTVRGVGYIYVSGQRK